MKKRLLKVFIIPFVCLVCAFLLSSRLFAAENNVQANQVGSQLSQMTEEECIEYITENGIIIPEEFAANEDLGEFVKGIIETIENDPNYEFIINYSVTRDFIMEIKNLVNDYYDLDTESQNSALLGIFRPYVLQDSTVYGSWSPSYQYYNCYSYSIDITNDWGIPGMFSGQSFDINSSISYMAGQVKADLESLGYFDVEVSSSMPDYLDVEKLICIRKTTTSSVKDFHFMKYDHATNAWYHKPSWTNPLKYKYTPTNSRNWTNEAVANGTTYSPSVTYNSEIYFISYATELQCTHDFEYVGNFHDHHQECTICGEEGNTCTATPSVTSYPAVSTYHVAKCHGFTYNEPHTKYWEASINAYRCTKCSWIGNTLNDEIKTEDYGYEGQYFFEELDKDITLDSGTVVTTTRLRTGIIDGYLVMSAKRNNAGTAYLEYHFSYNITRIEYQLALWSNSESLVLNSSIRLEALNTSGVWVTIRSFNATEMGQNKDSLISYTNEIGFASKAFRFIVETNMVQNENNRGRIVIGDVKVYRNHMHVYEAPYESTGESGHWATCSCGSQQHQNHVNGIHEYGDHYVNCMRCGYLIDLWGGYPYFPGDYPGVLLSLHSHDENCEHEENEFVLYYRDEDEYIVLEVLCQG